MVLKGIPTSVPVDQIQFDLTAQELRIVKFSQITKTDKVAQTLINKYPIFLVTFQLGTDISDVLHIIRYVTTSCDVRNTRTPSLYVKALTTNLLPFI